MRITKARIIAPRLSGRDGILRWNPVMVELMTDDGLTGVGEVGMAYGVGARGSVGVLQDFLEAFVIGKNPLANEPIWESMFRDSFWAEGGGPAVCGAMSAIDTALWDIKGKAADQPISELLGGQFRTDLRTYASQLQFGWSEDGTTFLVEPEHYGEAAHAAAAEGYDCVKVDPVMISPEGKRKVDLRGLFEKERLNLYRARMEAVRSAIGDDVDIILELHSFTSLSGALQLVELLEDLDILLVEEPVHYAWPKTHVALRQRCSARLAAGERFYTRWGAAEYLASGAIDMLQPDFGLIGGITEGKKVCDLAHLYDVTVQAHVCGGPVATATSLQIESAIPNFEIHEHHVYARQKCNRDICIEDLQPEAGRFKVPDRPGLGVALNEDFLRSNAELIEIS